MVVALIRSSTRSRGRPLACDVTVNTYITSQTLIVYIQYADAHVVNTAREAAAAANHAATNKNTKYSQLSNTQPPVQLKVFHKLDNYENFQLH